MSVLNSEMSRKLGTIGHVAAEGGEDLISMIAQERSGVWFILRRSEAKELPGRERFRRYNESVPAAALFDAEGWTFSYQGAMAVRSFELRCLRRMIRVAKEENETPDRYWRRS